MDRDRRSRVLHCHAVEGRRAVVHPWGVRRGGRDGGERGRRRHQGQRDGRGCADRGRRDRKSTRLNSSHLVISYAVFCLKKKKKMHLSAGTVRQYVQRHTDVVVSTVVEP